MLVCLILHNILITLKDEWELDEEEEEDMEEEDHIPIESTNGEELRLRVQNNLLRWYYTEV